MHSFEIHVACVRPTPKICMMLVCGAFGEENFTILFFFS